MSEKIKNQVWGQHSVLLPVLDDPAEDTDFVYEPADGTMVVADGKLSVKIDGTWEEFTPDS